MNRTTGTTRPTARPTSRTAARLLALPLGLLSALALAGCGTSTATASSAVRWPIRTARRVSAASSNCSLVSNCCGSSPPRAR
ncbi:hypothetical protein, partial [Kitasatospora sp. LaBMicrA B282]|uniref:hypothetical protein n=1 Tax=Kitasatospora sp. LaBMicrA B282 TaxID=3420949 RepID=UPI003D0F9875